MAENNLPKTTSELLDLGVHCDQGLVAQGAALNILQYTHANYGPLVTALQGRQQAFNARRTDLAGAYSPFHAAQAAMRKGCLDARKVISISLGDDWTTAWAVAGWTDHTTKVPDNFADLKTLCASLQTFLTNHVDYQIDTQRVVIIPQRYEDFGTLALTTETAVMDAQMELGKARDARKVDEKKLRSATRGLIDLLGMLLDPNSPMWDAFGLNRPGASVTPSQAALPTLAAMPPGKVMAQVAPVATATYYRWFAQLVGVDADFRFLGRTQDPMKEITALPSTGSLKVKVQAANPAGPGKASPVATIELAS